MKKRFLKLLCCGLAFLSMTACTEDEYLENEVKDIEFSAQIQSPELYGNAIDVDFSRTFIDENAAYESGVGTLWRAKEEIGVYTTGFLAQKNVKFTSTNSDNAGSVSFRGTTLGSPKYAYYPYNSANKNVSAKSVKHTMPILHEYSTFYKDLVGDFRAGTLESRSWTSSTFTLNRLVSLLRIEVNATGTVLEGSNIRTVSLKVSNKRILSGDFTINLESNPQTLNFGSFVEGNDSVSVQWSNEPTLSKGTTCVAYITALPTLKNGDEITFTIVTDTHVATFKRNSKVDFQPNYMYTYPLVLSNFSDIVITELSKENPSIGATGNATPVLNSMKFTVANNPGKILPGKVIGNKSTYKPTYDEDYYGTEVACTIDENAKKVQLYLPYLNNRKLIPTFEIPEGCSLCTEGGEVFSGQTEIDFTLYKQIAVVNGVGEASVYDVELTNSGLPVVVINQVTGVTSTETDNEYKSASNAWYAATNAKWVPKDKDWQMTEGVDNFMVYNADGTPAITDKNGAILSEPLFAGTRLRGNVTQQMPKKSFAVKLDKKSGVLDMKPHKRWVLLANWKDRTLMRNAVAFGIAKKFKETFPNDGIAWNPTGQHVELVYNGVHVGNYYLCEQIKIDGNRLDINDPYDAEDAYSGNPEDYGYLLECDDAYDETWKFTTANYIPFLFKDDANQEMLTYATNFVRDIEDKLYAGKYTEAYEKMDLTSVVDFLLIQELMMNSELKHPKSCYTYINNGKFYAGPIWDFDWNTLPTSSSNSEEGYSYTSSMLTKATCYHKKSGYPDGPYSGGLFGGSDKNYMWYPMLVKDATFMNLAAERWNAVKGALQTFVSVEIPQIQAKIAESDKVNNEMWPITVASYGTNDFGMGGGKCGDESYDFSKAISTLQSTLNTRINGMSYVSNTNWPSKNYTTK